MLSEVYDWWDDDLETPLEEKMRREIVKLRMQLLGCVGLLQRHTNDAEWCEMKEICIAETREMLGLQDGEF